MKSISSSKLIGRKIQEVYCQSFYYRKNISCDAIAIFLKLNDNYWYKLISGDGVSKILMSEEQVPFYVNEEPQLKDEFEYPIKKPKSNFILNLGEIVKIEEYLWKGYMDESFGFLITFDDDKQASFIESDDCLSIIEGRINDLESKYTLVELK